MSKECNEHGWPFRPRQRFLLFRLPWYYTHCLTLPLELLIPRVLGVGLLLDIVLGATLLCLADIVLLAVLGRRLRVARHAGNATTDGALEAVRGARRKIVELAAGLLLLARAVLVTARILEGLCC